MELVYPYPNLGGGKILLASHLGDSSLDLEIVRADGGIALLRTDFEGKLVVF